MLLRYEKRPDGSRFATRFDRRSIHFNGFIHPAAAMIWLR
jgi:hypothetical protein